MTAVWYSVTMTVVFSIFHLFFWDQFENEYFWIAMALNKMYCSMGILTLATKINKSLPTSTRRNKFRYYFSILRDFLLLHLLWGFVKQFLMMIPDGKFDMKKVNFKYVFGNRIIKDIWVELVASVVYKRIPLYKWISPLGLNFAYFTKVKPALANYRKYHKHAYWTTGKFSFETLDPSFMENLLNTIVIG